MRIRTLLIAACLALTSPLLAQEDYDPLLDDLGDDDLLNLPLEEAPPPASKVEESSGSAKADDDPLSLIGPDAAAADDDDLLDLDDGMLVDVPNPALENAALAKAKAMQADAQSDGGSDFLADDSSSDDGSTDGLVEKKVRKPRRQKSKDENQTGKIHNLSLMLSGALLIDTGNIGVTSPLLHLSVGARPRNGQLLVAGEIGWSVFFEQIPVYSTTYSLNINVLTIGAKVAYWFRPLDKISPYVAGNLALGLAFSNRTLTGEEGARVYKDVMANVAGSVQAGFSIPLGKFCLMPHFGFWITGFSGDYVRKLNINGPFIGLTAQFTP